MAARPARCLLVLAGALALALVSCRPAELSPGQIVAAALAPGEVHRYRILLEKGDFLRLTVDQQGIDLVAIFEDPSGDKVLEVDRRISGRGLELVMAVAATRGDHILVLRGSQGGNPGRYEARIKALQPASEAYRRSADAYRSFREAEALGGEKAMVLWTRALATWRELGETALEGEVLERMAQEHYFHRQWQPAADLYRQAAAAFARTGNPRWGAIARNGLGSSLLSLDQIEAAIEQHTLALRLARRAGDRPNQAVALHGLGQARRYQGDLQQALDCYGEALKLWPKDHTLRPTTLHQLGVLYARYLHDGKHGGELLREAWKGWDPRNPQDERPMSTTASQLGRLAYEQGRLAEARQHFEEALALRRKQDPCSSAVFLARLALVEEAQGARPAAEARIAEALQMVASQPCPRSEPTVRFLGADLAEKLDDPAGAQEGYRRCEQLFSGLGDRMGRAESLAGIARAARSLGDLQNAREASQQALDIVEGVRPTVLDEGLRISFFSGVQYLFDAHVALLLEMGSMEEAWATAERARARALGDLLAEYGDDLRRTAPRALIEKERALQRQLNNLESQRLRASEAKPEKLRALQTAIDAQVADLESLRGEIRRGSPSLTGSGPASPAVLRRELLDEDTLLLEYRLGETASTVWAVTRDTVTAYRLRPRSEIEPLAREAASWLQNLEWPGHNPQVLCDLSRMLLAPVAEPLGHHRRLAVVADGALEGLPFAALPSSGNPADCARAPLLVDTHETVSLPSAAALLTQRRLLAGRRPAPGWLAVVADPIYTPDQNLPALPGSAQEAEAITSGLPSGKVFKATGPAASPQTVTGGVLQGFRIVHFATHGTLNAGQPLLSSLALSGGFLRAHEIYDLDLPAELVVLSACDAQRGRDVPGEGLVSGLPRAFLYAGAARVLVSLWAVEDQSTRELMVLFYHGLFKRGLSPALALQEAQRTLYRAGRPPYQWAGFVLLGDWRPLPPFDR